MESTRIKHYLEKCRLACPGLLTAYIAACLMQVVIFLYVNRQLSPYLNTIGQILTKEPAYHLRWFSGLEVIWMFLYVDPPAHMAGVLLTMLFFGILLALPVCLYVVKPGKTAWIYLVATLTVMFLFPAAASI